MTDTADTTPTKTGKKADDFLALARKRLDAVMNASSDSRDNQLDDLKFNAASPDNTWQWPEEALKTRCVNGVVNARPALTINKIPQYVHQVTNDQRQNRSYGNVIPANDEGHLDVAEVFEGVIRHIGYTSDADVVYDTACDNIAIHGEGYFRIVTEFSNDDSFDQDIKLVAVQDPFSVYMDPTIERQCGEDAEWCFVLMNMLRSEFTTKFPDAEPVSDLTVIGSDLEGWSSEDTVRIAEYFCYETTKRTLNLYGDNKTAFEGTPEDGVYRKHYGNPIDSRQSDKKQVKWYKINGYEILEERDWAGKYIPIIRVIGNEFLIEGVRHISGLVRNMKDSQRMYNYHASNEVEMIALAPKAPYVGAEGQFEGFEGKWGTANINPWPYLEYNPVTDALGTILPPPQRSQPPMVQSGIIAAKDAASQDLKEVTGLYNASLGERGNERSGKAIIENKHEGDVGTFHYVDNLSRAIRYGTRQLIDLIPKIYDRPGRIARMLGEDNTSSTVVFDSTQKDSTGQPVPVKKVVDQQGNVIKTIYNPLVGKYDVLAVTGPGYATARREAAASMSRVIEANPELWKVAGDLFVETMDWPGSQKLAARIKKTIPPQLTSDDDEDPALQQAKQHIQQLTQELQQAHGMLGNVKNSIEAKELAIRQQDVQIKMFDAETKRITATAAIAKAATQDQAIQTPEQIQDVVAGTLHAAMDSGHIPAFPIDSSQQPQQGSPQPQEQAPPLDPNKVMAEASKHVLQTNQHTHEASMAEQASQQQPAQGGQQ